MNCLNCPNFWNDSPKDTQCSQCSNEKTLNDVVKEMPPLFTDKFNRANGYHLK